jgi:hypothetical protein
MGGNLRWRYRLVVGCSLVVMVASATSVAGSPAAMAATIGARALVADVATTTTVPPTTTTTVPPTTTTVPPTTTTVPPTTTTTTRPVHNTTTSPSTTPTPTNSGSSKTPWALIALIIVLVVAIVVVALLLRARKQRDEEVVWRHAVIPALSDAQLARESLLSENAMSDDAELRGAVAVQVERAAAALERSLSTAPDDAAGNAASTAAGSLRGLAFAIEADRLLRHGTAAPSGMQLAQAAEARRARSAELNTALARLSTRVSSGAGSSTSR